jgi:hypothetical protein
MLIAQLQKKFKRARKIDGLNFSSAKFGGLGELVRKEELSGFPIELYSMVVKTDGGIKDTGQFGLLIELIVWEGAWYIHSLNLSGTSDDAS